MKKLSLYVFLVLMFSLFTSHSIAAKKHKIYKRLPCSFNGVKVQASAQPYVDRKVRKNRCCPSCKGYKTKEGTSINAKSKKRGIPVVAITDMTAVYARNTSSEYQCIRGRGNKWGAGSVSIKHPITGKKQKCYHPYDNVSVYFKDDKYDNIIRYYHLMSTPLVPGFNKGKCKNPKFAFQVNFESQTSTIHAQNCGGFKYTKVKKGEVIGKMGKAGDVHFSLGIGGRKIDDGTDTAPKFFLIAPEDRFEWENLPTDSDAYLFPVMSKKYLEEIGYKK
jgi:hypothetical protein